jgi:hypothetical protein
VEGLHTSLAKCSILPTQISSKSPGAWTLMQPKPHITSNMWGHFRCLFASITPGNVYEPQFV